MPPERISFNIFDCRCLNKMILSPSTIQEHVYMLIEFYNTQCRILYSSTKNSKILHGNFLVQDIPPPNFSIFAQSIRLNSRVNLDRFCPLIVGLPIPSLVEYAQIIAQNSKSWASSSSCRFQGKYKDNLHHPPDSRERS